MLKVSAAEAGGGDNVATQRVRLASKAAGRRRMGMGPFGRKPEP